MSRTWRMKAWIALAACSVAASGGACDGVALPWGNEADAPAVLDAGDAAVAEPDAQLDTAAPSDSGLDLALDITAPDVAPESDADADTDVDAADADDVRVPDAAPDVIANGPDRDDDRVADDDDVEPDDPARCGDSDGDGCDDCTIWLRIAPLDDGFDADSDGLCDVALDPLCMHAEGADDDPWRRDACLMHALTNLERARLTDESGDAVPIAWDESVWRIARAHNDDMCARDFFASVDPDGVGPGERLASIEGTFNGYAENISGYGNPLQRHHYWMSEPTCTGHRGALLRPLMTRGAVAVSRCDAPGVSREGRMASTQDLLVDLALTPPPHTSPSPYCAAPATSCELPPEPYSAAAQLCALAGVSCDLPPDWERWGCPDD